MLVSNASLAQDMINGKDNDDHTQAMSRALCTWRVVFRVYCDDVSMVCSQWMTSTTNLWCFALLRVCSGSNHVTIMLIPNYPYILLSTWFFYSRNYTCPPALFLRVGIYLCVMLPLPLLCKFASSSPAHPSKSIDCVDCFVIGVGGEDTIHTRYNH